jgi:glycosyltransferase involved in cell wall biosynthesis
VAADGGGAAEFIEHEREGLIVEPEPRAIAEALDWLYADRARARAMGEHGQEKLRAMSLSWDHVVQSLIDGAG